METINAIPTQSVYSPTANNGVTRKIIHNGNGFSNIVLTGPATYVCNGTYFLVRNAD